MPTCLPVEPRLTPVAHSALFFSGLKTTLFDRGWTGSAPEYTTLKGRYIKLLSLELIIIFSFLIYNLTHRRKFTNKV